MRQFFSFIPALFCSVMLVAQAPINDDCSGLISLGTAPACPTTVYTNRFATNSNIGFDNNPTCFQGNLATRDVWFAFTCPVNNLDWRLSVTGVGATPLRNPQIAVYRGTCAFDNLLQFACAKGDPGVNSAFIDMTSLTGTAQYYVRVSDYPTSGAPNAGDFQICVDTIPDVTSINGGSTTLCSGTIYDTGGANGDYGPGEDHVFTICPALASSCITFTLDYFNIEAGDGFITPGDSLTFYDGPNISAPQITTLSGGGLFEETAGGGGVAFEVQATSGCLTVHFVSDSTVQFEGFQGHWVCSDKNCPPDPSIGVDATVTNAEVVSALSNPSNTVTVTSINCVNGSYGTYTYPGVNNAIGGSKGILLTSGAALLAVGPNNLPDAGLANGAPGDADLDYLSTAQGNGQESENACIVELDVFVRSDEMTFEYVFGSDEYPEWAGTDFNDIFAFLVSGPGITGDPMLNNAVNIAVLPDGQSTPVQINSVNNIVNWEYYRNNQIGTELQYDGLTSDKLGVKKSLTARQKVTPCQTYHLKFAIGDRGDDTYDSGVFIAEIQAGAPNLALQTVTGLDYFTETCTGTSDQIVITLSQPSTTPTSYNVSISGTATLGVDYTLFLPSVITFAPGQTQLSFPIVPIGDNVLEGDETIVLALTNNFGCGPVTYTTLVIEIKDNIEVEVLGGDTLFVCQGGGIQLQASGAVTYLWQPTGAVSNPTIPNPTIQPTMSMWLQVTGTLGTCIDVDSVYLKVVNPTIDVTPNSAQFICGEFGGTVQLNSTNNVNNAGLVWSPIAGLSDPFIPNPVATPLQTTVYTATVSLDGCSASDTVRIVVDGIIPVDLTTTDTTICQDNSVVLASEVFFGDTKYQWFPTTGLTDPTIANPVASPSVSTVYTVIASSPNGICRDTQTVSITVIPADVNIAGADTTFICLGTVVPLTATATPAGSTIGWAPSFYVSPTTGGSVSVNADESTWVYATYIVNGCTARDSAYIRVDSLPDNEITLQPVKPFYCPGDTIFLVSPTYEPANFPDIMLHWPPVSSEQTPDSLWNMVILGDEGTKIYTRYIQNNACFDTSTVTVTVVTPVEFMITGDTEICVGESTQLTVTTVPAGTAVEWKDPTTGLSCTTCPNPMANPGTTTTYTVTAKDAQCPANESITIQVNGVPGIAWPDPAAVCLGNGVLLNNALDVGQTYNWAGPGITNPAAKYPFVTPTVTSTYTVTITSVNTCTKVETKTIEVLSATVNAGVDQTVCHGTFATLSGSSTGAQGTITWEPGGLVGNSPTTMGILVPTSFVAVLNYGGGLNCVDTDTVRVNHFPITGISTVRIIDSLMRGDTICYGTSVNFRVTTTPANLPITWVASGINQSETTQTIKLTPKVNGDDVTEWKLEAFTTDANGCSSKSDSTVILYVRRCFDIPEAFSPNNDDSNDSFGVVNPFNNAAVPVDQFVIFNRWGQQIWQATPTQPRWDGRVDGKEAPVDTYIYHFVVRFPDGSSEVRTGEVTLLR